MHVWTFVRKVCVLSLKQPLAFWVSIWILKMYVGVQIYWMLTQWDVVLLRVVGVFASIQTTWVALLNSDMTYFTPLNILYTWFTFIASHSLQIRKSINAHSISCDVIPSGPLMLQSIACKKSIVQNWYCQLPIWMSHSVKHAHSKLIASLWTSQVWVPLSSQLKH